MYKLLTIIIVCYWIICGYNDYDRVKVICDVINSPKSTPTIDESIWIEDIRQEVIDGIKTSGKFKRSGMGWIIDSISLINFKIVDSVIQFQGRADACYINIKSVKTKFNSLLPLQIPNEDNFIVIKRNKMVESSYKSVVVHEIYHYYDRLLTGSEEKHYSELINMSNFLDENTSNEGYVKGKIMSLMLFINVNDESELRVVDGMYEQYLNNKSYYEMDSELFARYKTLKHGMLKGGFIRNIDDTISIKELGGYLESLSNFDRINEVFFLTSIDLDRLKELDELI